MEPTVHRSHLPVHPPSPEGSLAQPGVPPGTVYDRVERRRPHDRRHRDQAVYLDLRANKSERRQHHRRRVYEPGRRHWPEPPLGIDVWV
jgi:hypothetical protein